MLSAPAHAAAHALSVHTRPAPQVVPQLPQFFGSSCGSTQAPLQGMSGKAHAGGPPASPEELLVEEALVVEEPLVVEVPASPEEPLVSDELPVVEDAAEDPVVVVPDVDVLFVEEPVVWDAPLVLDPVPDVPPSELWTMDDVVPLQATVTHAAANSAVVKRLRSMETPPRCARGSPVEPADPAFYAFSWSAPVALGPGDIGVDTHARHSRSDGRTYRHPCPSLSVRRTYLSTPMPIPLGPTDVPLDTHARPSRSDGRTSRHLGVTQPTATPTSRPMSSVTAIATPPPSVTRRAPRASGAPPR